MTVATHRACVHRHEPDLRRYRAHGRGGLLDFNGRSTEKSWRCASFASCARSAASAPWTSWSRRCATTRQRFVSRPLLEARRLSAWNCTAKLCCARHRAAVRHRRGERRVAGRAISARPAPAMRAPDVLTDDAAAVVEDRRSDVAVRGEHRLHRVYGRRGWALSSSCRPRTAGRGTPRACSGRRKASGLPTARDAAQPAVIDAVAQAHGAGGRRVSFVEARRCSWLPRAAAYFLGHHARPRGGFSAGEAER